MGALTGFPFQSFDEANRLTKRISIAIPSALTGKFRNKKKPWTNKDQGFLKGCINNQWSVDVFIFLTEL